MIKPTNIICNASPLIALGKLNRLDILATLYPTVLITTQVYHEVIIQGIKQDATDAMTVRLFFESCQWPVLEISEVVLSSYHPSMFLDPGEISVLALARTLPDPLVLIDDEIARSEARHLKIQVRGTLGLLVQAYKERHIPYNQVELLIQTIAVRPDIWIGAKLCDEVLASLRKMEI